MTDADLGSGWNLVISALDIHHLTDHRKCSLYSHVRHALKPAGSFINAD